MPTSKDECPGCHGPKDTRASKCKGCGGNNRAGTGRKKYVSAGGYVMVWCGSADYRYEHRLVMEAKLGRQLLPSEHVHHRNHDRTDNRPENLVILDPREHAREHFLPRAHAMSKLGHAARWGM